MRLPLGSMRFFLRDALRLYTYDLRIITDENPYRFVMNGVEYSAHVSEIHFADRANPDEWRIQVSATVRELQRARRAAGDVILFIGFFPDGATFTGWEPDYVLSLNYKEVGSVYVPKSHLQAAKRLGGEVDVKRAANLSRKTAKISLRAEALGLYAENWRVFHSAQNSNELRTAMEALSDIIEATEFQGSTDQEILLGGKRKRVTVTRTAYARDPRFRDAVMRAYDGRCCVCGRQLGLVQAAHIIPHAYPDCVDLVTNGLALCIEHHRMYDDALLLPRANRQLHLNLDRVEHLKNTGRGEGLAGVQALSVKQYKVPNDAASRPENALLERGVRIRLGTDA